MQIREIFFNVFYVILFSLIPLAVFIISEKYLGDFYGFLASIFYIFQPRFIFSVGGSRTNVGLFFFALAIMTFFNKKKRSNEKEDFVHRIFCVLCSIALLTTYIFLVILFRSCCRIGDII